MNRSIVRSAPRLVIHVLTALAVVTSALAFNVPTPAQAVAAAPTVTGIAPAIGPVDGGQAVLIWGTGFATSGTINVTINGVACTGAALALSGYGTAVKCTTGAGTKGIGNVVVTNPDTQSGTLTNAYTYAGAADNTIVTWGRQTVGGNVSTYDGKNRLARPIDTTGALSGLQVVATSMGSSHACGLTSEGKAYCWGSNTYGQLGNGTTTTSQVPVAVSVSGVLSGKSIVQISAGAYHTCAVTTEGKVYCWGHNASGELGNNTITDSSSPVLVSTGAMTSKVLTSVVASRSSNDAASHTCALSSDGKAFCWGNNGSGQLGNNSTTNAKTAVAVSTAAALSGKTVVQITIAEGYSCALTSEGKASCWGSNSNGQLGHSGGNVKVPQLIDTTGSLSGKTLSTVSAGSTHACATDTLGVAYCWGAKNYGQVGVGTISYADVILPTAVDTSGVMSGATIVSISAGSNHTCARAANSRMYCWGDDSSWQTGQLRTRDQGLDLFRSPVAVDDAGALYGKRVVSLSAGGFGTAALITSVGAGSAPGAAGRLVNWGNAAALDAGFSPSDSLAEGIYQRSDPNAFLTGTSIASLSGSCVLTAAGTVGCWTSSTSIAAVDTTGVLSGKTVDKMAAFSGGACALTTDNGLYCWGSNTFGQLGNGTNTNSTVPVAVDTSGVLDGKTITDISAGYYVVCVLTSDQGIYCWGYGLAGSLGDGLKANSNVPVAVDLSGVLSGKSFSKISASGAACVVTTTGEVYCWGANQYGAVGSGSVDNFVATPAAVDTSGVLDGKTIVSVDSDGGHTCAVATDGTAYCWGGASNGELGNGANTLSRVPVAVDTTGALNGKSVAQISVSSNHTCALDTDGVAYCWGQNQYRQTGVYDTLTYPDTPVEVDTYGLPIAKIEADYTITYAVTKAIEGGDPAPIVSSVSPDSGLSLGGTSITIAGSNFATSGTVTVSIGGVACTSVSVTSDTEITCTTPAHAGGAVDVTVTNPDSKSGTGTNAFTYIGPPTVTSVSPSAGPEAGGTSITITGTGFLAGATVTVGGVECTTPSVGSATSITCTTGAHALGSVDVVVTNTDTQSGTGTNAFTYGNAVTDVSPAGGRLAGGTSITITGTGFADGATVTIGGSACTSVTFVSSTSITCTTPSGAAGLADVVVTNPNTDEITGNDLFEYVATPTVTSLSPTSGPTSGGTAVTITGTNFSTTGTVTVTVGGSACTDVDVTSSTEIGCNTPSGSAGAADVVVTNPYSVSGTGTGAYTYVAAPSVTSVSPTTVSTLGGTTITITGTAFATVGTVLVTVGSNSCTSVTVVSATSITCSTPATEVSTVGITVENPDGQKDTEASLLTFEAAPTVSSVSPVVGPTAGSTSITVTGTGFDTVGVVVVKVDGNACTGVSVASATSLTCTTPAGSAGSKSVAVTNPSALSGTLASSFRYVPNPTITSVDKTLLPIQGGNRITLTGTGFDTEYLQFGVKLGTKDCLKISALSATQAVCTAPAGLSIGAVNVVVTNLATTAEATLTNGIRYEDATSLINRLFPPPSVTNFRLLGEVKKLTDARGNCSREVNKFYKDVLDQVAQNLITAEQGKLLQSFYTSLCTAQLSGGPAPSALPNRVRVESVGPLDADPVPACSASFSTPSTALDFAVPDATITTFDYSRTDFEFAAMWVRSGEGEWSLGVTLDPANGGATGLVWSSDFVRALMYLAGVDNLSAQAVYNLQFAVGPGGTGDAYDGEGVVCSYNLSVFVGEIPATGTNTSVPTDMAVWFLCLGLGLAIIARRRHRPTPIRVP